MLCRRRIQKPLKSEAYRCVDSGDKIDYLYDPVSRAPSLIETKLLLNGTIANAKNRARSMPWDLKDFFLASPIE